MRDIPALLDLINGYAALGAMLPRTEFEMAENIRDFTVVENAERLAACGALHFYTPVAAEVRPRRGGHPRTNGVQVHVDAHRQQGRLVENPNRLEASGPEPAERVLLVVDASRDVLGQAPHEPGDVR